ncbi:MAG: ATP-binding cassette domain-containing protein [Myxococcota bacterium]|nr:ATP-binding cassette domain-containing protein [Myxococcota bacterium]MEC8424602.1 ATP-binding cassette domain-containing protein [Myxococcota bacterium]
MTAVSIRDLTLRRPGRAGFALQISRWDVPRGARVAIRGPSGCGKSTLLSLISGELEASAGSISVLGSPIGAMDSAARSAFRLRHVGLVPQGDTLLPWLRVRDNVLLPYRLGPALQRDPAALARADQLLSALGMDHLHDARAARLSAGESQRVAIARALVTQPSVLLADEPTSALDTGSAERVLHAIDALCAAQGTTALIATHDPVVVAAMPATVDMAGIIGGSP